MRLLFASTAPVTINAFMRGQLKWIAGQGYEVHVVSSPGSELQEIATREGVKIHELPMEREISIKDDLGSLREWVRLLRAIRPDVTVVGTPKAGLLGGLAAYAVRVPRRVYLMRGARFEGASGTRRSVLRATERISCASAHQVVAVSRSLAELAVAEGVVSADRCTTVGLGSSNGVDTVRFRPPSEAERVGERIRWGLSSDEVAIAFVGRLHVDKGLDVLEAALKRIDALRSVRVVLMLAGPDEGTGLGDIRSDAVQVRALGRVDDVPSLLRACDLLVLPTRREGFPNVVLEAAACGLPVVTTDATGAIDSVVDGETGFSVPKRDAAALAKALSALVADAELRRSMGMAARRRAELGFANELVWQGMLEAYLGTRR
jgi:glycosyltransferase involved in cell wall biosynthesis